MLPVGLLLLGLLAFCADLTFSEHPDSCDYPPAFGSCSGHKTRYFYNQVTNRCERFIYSGCNGNENNFKTQKKCHYTCVEKPGSCPKALPGTITICLASCGSDWQCPGKEKCCSYGCRTSCMNPR